MAENVSFAEDYCCQVSDAVIPARENVVAHVDDNRMCSTCADWFGPWENPGMLAKVHMDPCGRFIKTIVVVGNLCRACRVLN